MKLDCGHEPTFTPIEPHFAGAVASEPCKFTTGTAKTADGRTVCHVCAEKEELAQFNRPEQARFEAYLSSNGLYVTTWSGAILGRVDGLHKTRAGFGGGRLYFYVRDSNGRVWACNAPNKGEFCHMRRMKK